MVAGAVQTRAQRVKMCEFRAVRRAPPRQMATMTHQIDEFQEGVRIFDDFGSAEIRQTFT